MTMNEFNKLVLPLKNKLFRFALSIVANRELAEDLVQDTFLKLWKKRQDLSDVRNLEAWSMRMIKNQCLDYFKSKYVQTKSNLLDAEKHTFGISPLKIAEISDSLEKVNKIMDGLPEQQRMIMKMRNFQEYSYKEIAEVLEIEMNVVKVQIYRARQTIKAKIEKEESYGL